MKPFKVPIIDFLTESHCVQQLPEADYPPSCFLTQIDLYGKKERDILLP